MVRTETIVGAKAKKYAFLQPNWALFRGAARPRFAPRTRVISARQPAAQPPHGNSKLKSQRWTSIVDGSVVKAQATKAPVSGPVGHRAEGRGSTRHSSETPFGVALIDRQGNLLGAGTAGGLAGEVAVPVGVDLRREDLRSYIQEDLDGDGGRRFPLVSATWVQVKSRQVRVGIYMETGERLVNPERLDLDLGRIAAILSGQVVV
jgi:hypothetical protein